MINLSEDLNKHILFKAEELKDFLDSSGHRIGINKAADRLKNWCGNFIGLIPNMGILIPVIDKLTLIKDQDITDRVIEELQRKNKNLDSKSIFISSLGGQNESSHRIISCLNNYKNYIPNLHECLDTINKNQIPDSEIIFIDDFINSGGQFESIIQTLFGQKGKDGSENKRIKLTNQEQELLRKIKTSFFFYYGLQTGRELADKTLKAFKLNSNITIFEQYDDLKGIFGNTNSIEQISRGLSCYADSSSIFSGYKCNDIKPFYDICKQIGEQYLRKSKPETISKAVPASRPQLITCLVIKSGLFNTTECFSHEPMAETMPSPTLARIVSSPAPPIIVLRLALTVIFTFTLSSTPSLATA